MTVNGSTNNVKVKEDKYGKTDLFMKVTGKVTKPLAMED